MVGDDGYKELLGDAHLVPMWEVLRGMLPPEPKSAARAHAWPHAQWHPALMEAGERVSAEQAERRVLLLENPAYPGEMRVATTLHAGLQLLLPSELNPIAIARPRCASLWKATALIPRSTAYASPCTAATSS